MGNTPTIKLKFQSAQISYESKGYIFLINKCPFGVYKDMIKGVINSELLT